MAELTQTRWRLATFILGGLLVVLLGFMIFSNDNSGGGPESVDVDTPVTTVIGDGSDSQAQNNETENVTAGVSGLVAVKIDNAPAARPQIGLANVPLLLEYAVEGGLTRFVAVADTASTGMLGPVRSLRPVDADLVPVFAPSIASTGGQPFVIRDVGATGATLIEPGAIGGFTLSDAQAPHNVLLDLDELRPFIENLIPTQGAIPWGEPLNGAEAKEVSIGFAGIRFSFENGEYLRMQDGLPFQVLSMPGGPASDLTHEALIVLHVAERSAGYTDGNNVEVSTFDVIGSGDLEVFVEGMVTTGTWVRDSHDSGYEFIDGSGNPFGVSGDRIYVAFAPRGSRVEY